MAVSDLATLEELKSYLGIKQDTEDDFLSKLIKASTAYLLGQMNRQEGLDHDYQFTKGLPEVPEDIRFACLELAALRYKEKSRLGEISKTIAQQTVSYSQKDLSEYGRSVVNQYKRVTP